MNASPSLHSVGEALRDAMAKAGILTDDLIQPTGRIERFHVDGDKRCARNGWYVLFAGRVAAGAFGCWKRGIQERWCEVEFKTLSRRDRELVINQQIAARQQAELERRREHEAAAAWAEQVWNAAGPADLSHPYLAAKQVGAYGIRQKDRDLLIPLYGRDRRLWSLQRISGEPGRNKLFLPGSSTKARFHFIGEFTESGRCWLAEGYATSASVHEHYGEPCIVAFNAKNLAPVAKVARGMWPSKHLLIMADDDHKTPGNPGIAAAREATPWVDEIHRPVFTEEQKARGLTDYNDLVRDL